MTDPRGVPGTPEREALLALATPAEQCLNRILDQAHLAVANPGTEQETYVAALMILEEYVQSEIARRKGLN